MNIPDIMQVVRDFYAPSDFFSFKRKTAEQVVFNILELLGKMHASPLQYWEIVVKINAEFKQNATALKTDELKKAFIQISQNSNWKDALMKSHYRKEINVHFPCIKYSNHHNQPIATENRTLHYSGTNMSAVFGSTFCTDKPHRLNTQEHHLLDAAFGGLCFNNLGMPNGYALAVGDGSGGHFGDDKQDKEIARSAHIATKMAVRIFSAYDNPDALKNDLSNIPSLISQEMSRKVFSEGCTLVCCRAFPVKEGFRILGFNIGDGLLFAWNPMTQTDYPLLPSQASEAGSAFLPSTFRPFEVQYLDVTIPTGCYLYALSDGVHDTLPHTEEEKEYPNKLAYRTRTLSQLNQIFEKLTARSTPQDHLQTLVNASFAGAEALRQKQTSSANIQIGDDFSIVQCILSNDDT